MTGPITDSACLAIGGILGAFFGRWIPARVKETLPLIFGVITVSIGATLVGKVAYMHLVVFALIAGTIIGELLYVERGLEKAIKACMQLSRKHGCPGQDGFILQFVTLISIFCFGSMGLFGAFNEGITHDPTILLTKAVLDLFTAMIFGALLGSRVALIAIPQFAILAAFYLSARFVGPFVSKAMLGDFSACGGIIFFATGLRLCGIKIFPVINMLPALAIILPLTYFWTVFTG